MANYKKIIGDKIIKIIGSKYTNDTFRFDERMEIDGGILDLIGIGNLYGFIDKRTGEIVTEPCYEQTGSGFYDQRLIVLKGDKYGAVNLTGKLVIPAIYDYLNEFDNGMADFERGDEQGWVDKYGKEYKVRPAFIKRQ